MENVVNFEVLLCIENELDYDIIGITYSNSLQSDNKHVILKASFLTIQKVKELLFSGKKLKVAKHMDFPEVTLNDIVIVDENELETDKNIAINSIAALMHENIIGVSLIDAMDYMDCYMKLMNAGIFITNTNREDKYFEIIEKAQSIEEPEEISDTASFEEEVEYVEKKKQYDEAQDNLNTLEKYLNAYDALSKIRFTNTVLSEAKTSISNANNRDDIINAINIYQEKLKLFDKNTEV